MASKQISYCSLEEAWGEKYANLYKKNDDMLTVMPQKTDNDINILKDRSLTNNSNTDMEKYYMNLKKDIKDIKDIKESKKCEYFIEHLLECEDCKDRINKILGTNKIKESSIETFMNNNIEDNYLDIIILILLGIFIIFIFDCFVRLGRNFRK